MGHLYLRHVIGRLLLRQGEWAAERRWAGGNLRGRLLLLSGAPTHRTYNIGGTHQAKKGANFQPNLGSSIFLELVC